MDDQTVQAQTLIGWLVAALAAAWGWIVKRMIVGRMDDIERDLARKAEAEDCRALAARDVEEHKTIAGNHNLLAQKLDSLAVEMRRCNDETRREIKGDLAVIVDLIKERQ